MKLNSLIQIFTNQGLYVNTGQRNNGAAVYRNTNSDARVLYCNGDGTWAASNSVDDGVLGGYVSVDSASCPQVFKGGINYILVDKLQNMPTLW